MPGITDLGGSLSQLLGNMGVDQNVQRLLAGSTSGGGVTITVKVQGLAELEAALEQLPGKVAKGCMVDAMTQATQAFLDRAIELAPYGTEEKDGMHLVDGIKKEIRTGSKSVAGSWVHGKVGLVPEVFYGRFIEFGWTTPEGTAVPAHPFMRPAFDGTKYHALAIISQKLEAGIQAAAGELHSQ